MSQSSPNGDAAEQDEFMRFALRLWDHARSTSRPSTGVGETPMQQPSNSDSPTAAPPAPMLRNSASAPPTSSPSASYSTVAHGSQASSTSSTNHAAPTFLTSNEAQDRMAPPITTYRPLATNTPASSSGHPSPTAISSNYGSTQPFIGLAQTHTSLDGNVNQRRLTASASHQPRATRPSTPRPNSSATRSRNRNRVRGPARPPPSLPTITPTESLQDCILEQNEGEPLLCVIVKVYPPQEKRTESYFYKFLRHSWNQVLATNGLLFHLRMPLSTPVVGVIEHVSNEMKSSTFDWEFATGPVPGGVYHENLPLQILSFVNRGAEREADGQIRLKRTPTSPTDTMARLTSKRACSRPFDLTIESGEFVLNMIVKDYPLRGRIFFDSDADISRHHCVSERIYRRFPMDQDGTTPAVDATELATSCSSDDEDDDLPSPSHMFTPVVRRASRTNRTRPPPLSQNASPTPMPLRDRVSLASANTATDTDENTPPTNGGILSSSGRASDVEAASTSASAPPTNGAIISHSGRSSDLEAALTNASAPSGVLSPSGRSSDASTTVSAPIIIRIDDDFPPGPPAWPNHLWADNWTASRGGYENDFDVGLGTLTDFVGRTSNNGYAPVLEIRGSDVTQLAAMLVTRIERALGRKDFTSILSPNREYLIIAGQAGHVVSLGHGIEREVLHTAFRQFELSAGRWFLPRLDGKSTIATTVSSSFMDAVPISPARTKNLGVLGALIALLLVHGIVPETIDVCFLNFLVHGCDLRSLTEQLIKEWHPELAYLIRTWIDLGPAGAVSQAIFGAHFSSIHDLQLSTLEARNQAAHNALACQMLYRSIVGVEPPHHPEIQAFYQGFRLPCNNGFNFCDVVRSHPGGSEAFFSILSTSLITSYESIRQQLRIEAPSVLDNAVKDALQDGDTEAPRVSFSTIVAEFLSDQGIPYPSEFEALRSRFSPLIDLSAIDSPSFRPRMLAWALIGSPTVDIATHELKIILCADGDTAYTENAARPANVREGTISFRTCAKTARVPCSYFESLSDRVYPPEQTPPLTLKHAVFHWLLVECLSAIRDHSMM